MGPQGLAGEGQITSSGWQQAVSGTSPGGPPITLLSLHGISVTARCERNSSFTDQEVRIRLFAPDGWTYLAQGESAAFPANDLLIVQEATAISPLPKVYGWAIGRLIGPNGENLRIEAVGEVSQLSVGGCRALAEITEP